MQNYADSFQKPTTKSGNVATYSCYLTPIGSIWIP